MSQDVDLVGGCVIYAADMQRIASFYQGVVGLETLAEDESHVRLCSNGFELVVLQIPKAIASTITINSPPDLRASTPAKVVYRVEDLSTCRRRATELGGQLYEEDSQWEFVGMVVCDGWDPEGNVFQLRQAIL